MHLRSKRLTVALVGAAALVASQLAVTGAHANHGATLDIQVGADFFENDVPGFSVGFYPRAVTVHKGDTLHFFGFGAPVLLPKNAHPEDFIQENAANLGDRYFDLAADPDEGADGLKFNINLFTGNTECGATVADPCSWDGSGDDILNVGDQEELFVTIDANPGDTVWAALTNTGNSKFRIDVVNNNDLSSTQPGLDAAAERQLDQDFNTALATHSKMLKKQTKHRTASGKVVWDAWAGIDRGPISLLAFYPAKLKVKKGQSVMWHFELQNEVHNVTFPFKNANRISNNTFVPVCDPDGDEGSLDDVEATFPEDPEALPECPDGSELEFDIHPQEIPEVGNGVFLGSDLEKSATKGYERAGGSFFNDDPWTLRFNADDGTYKFGCTIHGPRFMGGKVVVKS